MRSEEDEVDGVARRLFRGGLVFKAHRWLYHRTLGSRVIKKREKKTACRVEGLEGEKAREREERALFTGVPRS